MTFSKYGKPTFSVRDKIVAAMLLDENTPDDLKDRLIAEGRAEVQETWDEVERERRSGIAARRERGEWIRENPTPQIEVHHTNRGVTTWRTVG